MNPSITSNSPGTSLISVVGHVNDDGSPIVVVAIKKSLLLECTLDGEPAVYVTLHENPATGKDNGPWELGHLLCNEWDKAVKKAKEGRSVK